ncbi:hypothetical protein P4O66_021094, partial [Electrophorus voltai]
YIEQLQGELKAQNTIINQLRNRSTNQSSGHQPGHAHNSTLTTLREDDIRDLKNLLELKDFELPETKINQEASKNNLQQALKDKEKQIQGLHDILEGHIQDLAEKDAALAETTSELNNLESDVGKLILQLENRKQQLQLMSGQLQESVRESQLLKQRLRYTEAFTHSTYQIQASVKKDHSGRNSGSVCKSSFRSVIKALICCSDPAQPCLSSRAHVHGLHVLVPREIYDTLLEQMCEGRGLISHASELIQRLQTHGRHHMQVHAHPSVRIRGTEHTYTPVLCQDDKCDARDKGVHMHCPLCTVGEAYQDPIILRAHFRIKHVDKGIDFAGLKVLRCCNHCEIVGTIKGEKRFKGAHWHCYRCRNGFNRRDEAVKHYRTHFRNPHTTFQIQVTQVRTSDGTPGAGRKGERGSSTAMIMSGRIADVNCRQYYSGSAEAHERAYSGLAVSVGSGPAAAGSVIAQSLLTTASDPEAASILAVEPKEEGESNGIPLGAEEEVGSSQHAPEQTQTLVLMDPEGHTGSLIYDEATGILAEQVRGEESLEQTLLQKRLIELSQQIGALHQEKDSMEKTLRAEIKQLREQVASLVQSNVKMFEELQVYQSPEHSQQRLATLMETLQSQHKELLQAQLASVRQELLSQASAVPLNGHTGALEHVTSRDWPQARIEEQEEEGEGEMGGAPSGLELIDVQLQPEQDEPRGQMVEFEPTRVDTLAELESPASDTPLTDSTSPDLEPQQEASPTSRKRGAVDSGGGTSEAKVPRVS